MISAGGFRPSVRRVPRHVGRADELLGSLALGWDAVLAVRRRAGGAEQVGDARGGGGAAEENT